jgi:hypothetical protein
MLKRASGILWALPFLVVGVGFIVGAYTADPAALTDDGYPLKTFLYVMGGFFLLLPVVVLGGFALVGAARRRKIENLMATGQQGEAAILSLEDTGVRINDNPRVRLLLEIRIPGYSPYQVEKTLVIPLIRLAQVQVGSTVQVLADPNQPDAPDKVALLLR